MHADVLIQADGRSKGCGIVEYATTSEAQRAINELSNQTLNGRMVYIREVGQNLFILEPALIAIRIVSRTKASVVVVVDFTDQRARVVQETTSQEVVLSLDRLLNLKYTSLICRIQSAGKI